MQQTPRDPRITLVLVGFSPPERLAPIARHLGWQGAVLGDPERALYHRLGIGRAPWWRVYSPGTLRQYALSPRRITRPSSGEDTRQLGADAVAHGDTVVARWRPTTPNDRPSAEVVLARAACELPTAGPAERP